MKSFQNSVNKATNLKMQKTFETGKNANHFAEATERASLNLFKGYSQKENGQTHAFLSFLNFLKNCDERSLTNICNNLKIFKKNHKIIPESVKIEVLPSKAQKKKVTWDGQIQTSKLLVAIECKINKNALRQSQLKRHFNCIRNYPHGKLILITPFDRDWLLNKYPKLGKNLWSLSTG